MTTDNNARMTPINNVIACPRCKTSWMSATGGFVCILCGADVPELQPVTTTDNTLDLEDAIRALRDRPSMEAELTALRDENLRLVERKQELVADNARLRQQLTDLTGKAIAVTDERDDLRRWKAGMHTKTKAIMDEECGKDEKHCTCVPLLRVEAQRWHILCREYEADNIRLRSELEAARAALRDSLKLECGRIPEQGFSAPCWGCVRRDDIARAALAGKEGGGK